MPSSSVIVGGAGISVEPDMEGGEPGAGGAGEPGEAEGRGATVISSNGKSVKLDDGTRLLLVVQEKKGEAATQ